MRTKRDNASISDIGTKKEMRSKLNTNKYRWKIVDS